jgi:hypothetical protein
MGFKATGHFSDQSTQDLTTQATWDSTDRTVASVSNLAGTQGLATGIAAGRTSVTATWESKSGSASLTVTQAQLLSITVAPENPTIAAGATQQFTATGHYQNDLTQDITNLATWDSSDQSVAAISNAAGSKGLATAVAKGTSTISASAEGRVGSTLLTVRPPAARFVRCDSNQDGRNDIADGVRIVDHLFHAQEMGCLEAGDCNDDGRLSLGDALYCFDYQLREGPVYPPPFPTCGEDGSDDTLTCESFPRCK